MKKLGIITLLLICTTVFYAQQGQRMSPEERQAKTITRLTKTLDLNKQQIVEITAFYDVQTIKTKNIMDDKSIDRKDKRAAMMEIMKETDNSVKTVLTDKQIVKFDEYIRKRDEEMADRQQQGGQKKKKDQHQ